MSFVRSGGLRTLLVLSAVVALAAIVGAAFFYTNFVADLPELRGIEDYRPALSTVVTDRHGRRVGEFAVERRTITPLVDIPEHSRQAFICAEDSKFYEHAGIDYVSILRAAWVDLRAGGIRQGASTITMQLVKQILLSPERRFRRKIREMILARRIEQHFSKDEILFLYMTQIYFGQGAWGIGEAARTYFDKTPAELTISESALLAGLPQRPSDYSPFRNPKAAESRRRYVLGQMLSNAAIDQATYDAELAAPPELAEPRRIEEYATARYFTEEVRRYLYDRLGSEAVLSGGLRVETTVDLDLQRAAVDAITKGLEDHDKRQGYRGPLRTVAETDIGDEISKLAQENELEAEDSDLASERLGLIDRGLEAVRRMAGESEDPTPATPLIPVGERLLGIVVAVDGEAQTARVAFAPGVEGEVLLEDVSWAREPNPRARAQPVTRITRIFGVGDVAWFERLPDDPSEDEESFSPTGAEIPLARLALHQEPIVQGGLLSIESGSGNVLAMVGGYDFAKSEFNRVTQARRQPGSAFKPFIYGAALARNYSPVTTLYDRPVVYEDPISGFVWRPQNYGRQFYGPIPMRSALARSVNNATVHLFRDVGVDYVIDYARRLGIQSPLSRDLSLALGSSGVSLAELTAGYAVFPNRGRRVVPRFITRVTDRDGEVLLEDIPLGNPPPPVLKPLAEAGDEETAPSYPDAEILPTDQIFSEEVAYLMCDLLKGVVKDPRGTGWRLRKLGRPLAGKTGTTNDQADAWFVGFSPDVTTGVWVGHDQVRLLGWGETGSRAAAPIWVDYMEVALAGRSVRDFDVPDQIVFERIDRATGLLADANTADAYFQPFIENTEPTESTRAVTSATDARRTLRDDLF